MSTKYFWFYFQISAQRSIRSASNDVEKPQKEGVSFFQILSIIKVESI